MRRNTITLLKYLIGSTVLVTTGVFLLHGVHRMRQPPRLARGNEAHVDPPHWEPNQAVADDTLRPVFEDIIEKNKAKQERIDWHNYKAISAEKERDGPGEHGAAYVMSAEDKKRKQELYRSNGFNALASDQISLDRSIKDIRHRDCHKQTYLKYLPSTSFILPFHNEHLSVLLRSVHSILNKAPKELVKEIILADDCSTKDENKKPLDDYVKDHFTNVIVVRAEQREGLIRTRLMGAKHATGEVLIFLDSHIECNVNFLPPLLEPIALDYRTAVCPFIDVIDYETFNYRAQDEGARGAFDWEFFYKRIPLLEEDKKHPARPFANPVMAGGLFAISKDWFWELGGYDPGLDIWGGEQYELSFKIWQCGGRMVDAPCSRIGHIYRRFFPFKDPGAGNYIARNHKRVLEVWMDEYAEFFYRRNPHYRDVDPGDLTEQKKLRQRLQCKPFKWFMENIAFDLPKFYPPIDPPSLAEGELRNKATHMCVDTINNDVRPRPCKDNRNRQYRKFVFTWRKAIRSLGNQKCLDVSYPIARVSLFRCHGMKGNQRFKYNLSAQQLYHPVSDQCMDSDNQTIYMNTCRHDSASQKWIWERVDEELVRKDFEEKS